MALVRVLHALPNSLNGPHGILRVLVQFTQPKTGGRRQM